MVYTEEVAQNVYLIDENLYGLSRWGSVYLLKEDKKALIDSGPSTSAANIIGGLGKLGVSPGDIDYIVVTHIHLDHGGGAGTLAREMPRAKVVVHHRGARHLVNPERLLKAVLAAQGEEAMARLGGVVPIDPERVQSIYGGEALELGGGQTLRFIDAPGHAPHELCIQESRNGGLFLGDAVGVYTGAGKVLVPVTPVPDFDMELYIATVEKLISLDASRLYFGHFGKCETVRETLQLSISKLRHWFAVTEEAVAKGGFEEGQRRLVEQGLAELEPLKRMDSFFQDLHRYLGSAFVFTNAAGFMKYYREKHGGEMDKRRKGESN